MVNPDRLRSLSLFEGLSDADVDRCAAPFQETEILKGSGLAKEGDFAYKFFIVLAGEVDVLRKFEFVARLGPGDFFGEMALVSGERRNARVTAHTRCHLASIMAWDFATLAESFPSVAAEIEKTAAERMATLPDASD